MILLIRDFPLRKNDKSRDDLVRALGLHRTVSAWALSLSNNVPEDDFSGDDDSLLQPSFPPSKDKIDSLQSLLKQLGKNMSQERVKVKIEDDILNYASAHYKSPEFDVKKKLRNQFKGEPAVTQVVLQENFTQSRSKSLARCSCKVANTRVLCTVQTL